MCKRNKRYTQQLEQYEEAVQKLNGIISMIALTESGKITDPDDALDLFGKYTECLFDSYSFSEEIDESSRICMRSFSVNIGKWIYLMDAFDDYYSDRRASRFNLIDLFSESDQHRANDINKDILDKILYVHLILSDNIKNISENLCWAGHREIIDNIVRKGMDARFVYVLKKRYGRFTG